MPLFNCLNSHKVYDGSFYLQNPEWMTELHLTAEILQAGEKRKTTIWITRSSGEIYDKKLV